MAFSKNRRLSDIISDTSGNLSAVGLVVPTQSASDNDTSAASTAYVTTAIANLSDSAPSTLNTLNELAAALGDDANFSTTITNSIATKLPLAGGTLTGNLAIGSTGDGLSLSRSGYDTYSLQHSAGNGMAIYNVSDSRNEMHFAGDGKIGIGTATPTKTLHIEHTGGASEGILITGASDTAGHTAGIFLRAEAGESDSDLRAKGAIFFERTGTYGVGKLHLANDIGGDNTSATISDARLTIGTSGRVGINETSPDSQLHVNSGTTNVAAKFESTDGTTAIQFTDNTGSAEIGCSGDDVVLFPAGSEKFRVENSTGYIMARSASNVRLVLGSTGNSSNNTSNWIRGVGATLGLNSASGPMTFEIGGSEKVRFHNQGGITFNGDSGTANALDDYEEGTWTPTINSGTLGTAYGYYTKIGRQVTISYYIIMTTTGTSSTAVRMGGLPYTSSNTGPGMQTAGSLICRYFTKNQIVSYLARNETNLEFYNNSSGDWDQIQFGELEPSYDIDFAAHGTHTYFV